MHHEPAVPLCIPGFLFLKTLGCHHRQPEDFKSSVFAQTTLLNQGLQESALPPVQVACESPAIQEDPFRVYSFSRNSNPSSAFLFLWQTGLKISGWEGNDFCTFLSVNCSHSWSRSGLLLVPLSCLPLSPVCSRETAGILSLSIKWGQAALPAQFLHFRV